MTTTAAAITGTGERADLLETLRKHRGFLRFTVRDLTDRQAAHRPTASHPCLGGLIKHVTEAESNWADFIVRGPKAMVHDDEARVPQDWLAAFSYRARRADQLAPASNQGASGSDWQASRSGSVAMISSVRAATSA